MKTAKTSSPPTLKITKCSCEKSWYKDLIGSEFIIESESTRDYYVIHNNYIRGILKKDSINLN